MYKKEAGRTGDGQNPFNTPTELQFKIANIMAPYLERCYTVPGTNLCDTSNSYHQNLSDSTAAASSSSTQLHSHLNVQTWVKYGPPLLLFWPAGAYTTFFFLEINDWQ